MRSICLVLVLFSFCSISCTSNESGSSLDTTANMGATNNENRSLTDTMGNDTYTEPSTASERGKELISKSDCLGCHKDYEKLIGPSYAEVAAKYKNDPDQVKYLVGKILKGGSGVWGEIPMTPHPSLSVADATEMVNYILRIK